MLQHGRVAKLAILMLLTLALWGQDALSASDPPDAEAGETSLCCDATKKKSACIGCLPTVDGNGKVIYANYTGLQNAECYFVLASPRLNCNMKLVTCLDAMIPAYSKDDCTGYLFDIQVVKSIMSCLVPGNDNCP